MTQAVDHIFQSDSVDSRMPSLSRSGQVSIHDADGVDHLGGSRELHVVAELPLKNIVDGFELVTLMTMGSHPEILVLGYLRNQTLFESPQEIASIEVNWSSNEALVTTQNGEGLKHVNVEQRTVTTGCGQGTILSCTLDKLYDYRVVQTPIKQSDIYRVLASMSAFNQAYRAAGSVHGCGLFKDGQVLLFVEDVGRHNAMDAIAGEMWFKEISPDGAFIYTTGRLTSEMVMKAALMGISVLISRNGTTFMGQELAVELGVMLIARAKGRQFTAFNADHLVFDAVPTP